MKLCVEIFQLEGRDTWLVTVFNDAGKTGGCNRGDAGYDCFVVGVANRKFGGSE
jgi:hypothetical protein